MYLATIAFCDLTNVKLFGANLMHLTPKKRKNYRCLRGVLMLILAMVAAYVFYVEFILKINYSLQDSCLYFGVPYTVPLISLLVLNYIYKIFPFNWK